MIYEKYEGSSSFVKIENIDENNVYTGVGSKAFLSCKNVYEIELPETIREIGDWSFSHMKELKKIVVPANDIIIGRDAFSDCKKLQEVVVYPDDSKNEGLPFLLASCLTVLGTYKLFNPKMASESNEDWCDLYDEELIRFINYQDDRGFQPFIVGWFNDEGEEEQLERYINEMRCSKFRLCFLRLKYDMHIKENTKNILVNYIRKELGYMDDDNNSSWVNFRDELSDDLQYVKIASCNSLLSDAMKEELVTYINRRNGNPETVAYLLSQNEDTKTIEELFEL